MGWFKEKKEYCTCCGVDLEDKYYIYHYKTGEVLCNRCDDQRANKHKCKINGGK